MSSKYIFLQHQRVEVRLGESLIQCFTFCSASGDSVARRAFLAQRCFKKTQQVDILLSMLSLYYMPQLLVRNLDKRLVSKLKERAKQHGVSAEEEHRQILHAVLNAPADEKPSFIEFLSNSNGDASDIDLPLERSQAIEERPLGI